MTELPWRDVRSSNVRRLAWVPDEDRDTEDDVRLGSLYVEWVKTDKTSRYHDVTEAEAALVASAESIGRAVNALIKTDHDHEYVEKEGD
jgi:hypothetical protein